MAILITILLGALVGWLASIVTGRNAEQGAIENILVGISGAFLATLIFSGFNYADAFISFDFSDVLVSFIGAVVVCIILNLIQRNRVR